MKPALLLLLIAMAACGGDGVVRRRGARPATQDDLIKENRDAMRLEDRDIDLYLQRHAIAATTSGTGVRMLLLRDEPGTAVRPEQVVAVNYRLELLNGDSVYATGEGRPESFRVEHDDVESGLHEAIQTMSAGDSAIIVIPSYRAHGLIGDLQGVPPRSSVVYRIGVVRVGR